MTDKEKAPILTKSKEEWMAGFLGYTSQEDWISWSEVEEVMEVQRDADHDYYTPIIAGLEAENDELKAKISLNSVRDKSLDKAQDKQSEGK